MPPRLRARCLDFYVLPARLLCCSQVCFACVEEGEFKLAQLCGLNIIVNADDLDEVSEFYQRRGHFEQLMALMESGLVGWLLLCVGLCSPANMCVSASFVVCHACSRQLATG